MTPPPRPSRETVAALAARAQALTAEANELLAGAMREAVDRAGGLSGVAVETARDVVQYLTRRGRMARDEAERLLAAAEDAAARRVAAGRVPRLPVAEAPPAGPAKKARVRKAGAKRATQTPPEVPPAADAGGPAAEALPAEAPSAKKARGAKKASTADAPPGQTAGRARPR